MRQRGREHGAREKDSVTATCMRALEPADLNTDYRGTSTEILRDGVPAKRDSEGTKARLLVLDSQERVKGAAGPCDAEADAHELGSKGDDGFAFAFLFFVRDVTTIPPVKWFVGAGREGSEEEGPACGSIPAFGDVGSGVHGATLPAVEVEAEDLLDLGGAAVLGEVAHAGKEGSGSKEIDTRNRLQERHSGNLLKQPSKEDMQGRAVSEGIIPRVQGDVPGVPPEGRFNGRCSRRHGSAIKGKKHGARASRLQPVLDPLSLRDSPHIGGRRRVAQDGKPSFRGRGARADKRFGKHLAEHGLKLMLPDGGIVVGTKVVVERVAHLPGDRRMLDGPATMHLQDLLGDQERIAGIRLAEVGTVHAPGIMDIDRRNDVDAAVRQMFHKIGVHGAPEDIGGLHADEHVGASQPKPQRLDPRGKRLEAFRLRRAGERLPHAHAGATQRARDMGLLGDVNADGQDSAWRLHRAGYDRVWSDMRKSVHRFLLCEG